MKERLTSTALSVSIAVAGCFLVSWAINSCSSQSSRFASSASASQPESSQEPPTLNLQPGRHYEVRKDAGVIPCPGVWADYDALDGMSNNDRLRTVLEDGGTTLIGGDSFTVVGFGSGIEAPVRIRSDVNRELCWLTDDAIQGLIQK